MNLRWPRNIALNNRNEICIILQKNKLLKGILSRSNGMLATFGGCDHSDLLMPWCIEWTRMSILYLTGLQRKSCP